MSPDLIRSAELIARIMPAHRDWWIIGSAALALSGIDVEPKDIDVFASAVVIEAARAALGVPAMPSGSDRFRSSPYFQYRPEDGVEIDFMGGLEVHSEGCWVGLQIESKMPVSCGSATLFVPSLKEQARVLRLFGRPKDLARAALVDIRLREP
jgi:hypothetical protein